MNKDTDVMEQLNRSEVYGECQKALGEVMELPLTLRPLETWQPTHQVAVEEAPSEGQFSRITQQIVEWGSQIDAKQLREAYFTSKLLSRSQYAGVVRLLEIFGRHLSLVANQIALREAESESPLVRRPGLHRRPSRGSGQSGRNREGDACQYLLFLQDV